MSRRPRRPPPYRPPLASGRVYVRLEARHVALLRFVLEAEDNLALPTVVDRFAAVVRLQYSPDDADRVEDFVTRLAAMCPEVAVCYRPRPSFPLHPDPAVLE